MKTYPGYHRTSLACFGESYGDSFRRAKYREVSSKFLDKKFIKSVSSLQELLEYLATYKFLVQSNDLRKDKLEIPGSREAQLDLLKKFNFNKNRNVFPDLQESWSKIYSLSAVIKPKEAMHGLPAVYNTCRSASQYDPKMGAYGAFIFKTEILPENHLDLNFETRSYSGGRHYDFCCEYVYEQLREGIPKTRITLDWIRKNYSLGESTSSFLVKLTKKCKSHLLQAFKSISYLGFGDGPCILVLDPRIQVTTGVRFSQFYVIQKSVSRYSRLEYSAAENVMSSWFVINPDTGNKDKKILEVAS